MYFFKVNDEKAKTMRKICLKLTIETSEQNQRRCSSVFTVIFEQISQISHLNMYVKLPLLAYVIMKSYLTLC